MRISNTQKAVLKAAALFFCLTHAPAGALADVVFTGLTEAQEENARAVVPLAEAACDSGQWRVKRLFEDADVDLRNALRALGYYDIKIEKKLTEIEGCWRAEFNVVTGEPVRYRAVDLNIAGEALQNAPLLQRIEEDRPRTGDILNHGEYESFKSALLQRLSNNGFFDAEFTESEVIVDPATKSADLQLHVASGPRYHYGEISFTQGILRDRLLQNYTDIEEGDVYDSTDINKLFEDLNNSGYFSSVSISTDPVDSDAATAPVTVSLRAAPRRNYSIGAGFSTDTGPQGRAGYINRRRNQLGHQFEARLFGSEVKSEATATYRWPRSDPRTEWYSVGAGYQHENTETSKNDTYKLGVLRTRSLSSSWLESRYLDFAYEQFLIGDQDTFSRLVIFGISRESVKGREISRSLKGRRINLDLRGASDSLGSDTSFMQLRINAKWLWSLNDSTRVMLRGRAGTTWKDALADLPPSVRFFSGGDRSVRGYAFESLGPVDANGDVIGGSNVVEGSFEIDRLVRRNWAIAAFVDTGSAFGALNADFSTGVGVGFRWYSPVGPIRVDFAHPLDDPSRNFRLHISLGPDL
jgi:translocation and assembly module TamA